MLSAGEERYEGFSPTELAHMRASGGESKYRALRADWLKRGRPQAAAANRAAPLPETSPSVTSPAQPSAPVATIEIGTIGAPPPAQVMSMRAIADRTFEISEEMKAIQQREVVRLGSPNRLVALARSGALNRADITAHQNARSEADEDKKRELALANEATELMKLSLSIKPPRRAPSGDAA